MNLNDIQVIVIENELKNRGLQYAPLQDELIDHVCCRVEESMREGLPFQEAVEAVFNRLDRSQLNRLQRKSRLAVLGNRHIMKKLTLATTGLAACCIMITSVMRAQQAPSRAPLKSMEITSGFGMKMHPVKKSEVLHKGIDLKAPAGAPVMATADGKVIMVAEDVNGYGKYITVDHGANIFTRYAQLSEFLVEVNMQVKQGQVIGLVGSSGASNAPHLHYEVIKNEQPVDPEDYMPRNQE